MSLYLIQHDGQGDYVEANGIGNAEQVWRAHVRSEPDNADFNEEPDSIALLSTDAVIRQDQPCQKTNANAGTTGIHTTVRSESLTGSYREHGATSATVKSGDQSATPSEPEAVTALRHDARAGRSMVPNDRIRTVVDYIDTLSARLKRAEGLLHRAVPFLADNGHMEQQIENFIAEKGDA